MNPRYKPLEAYAILSCTNFFTLGCISYWKISGHDKLLELYVLVKVKLLKSPKFWRENANTTKSLLTVTYYSKLLSTNYGTWSGPVDAVFTSKLLGLREWWAGGRLSNKSVVIFRVTNSRFEKVVHCPANHNVCKV